MPFLRGLTRPDASTFVRFSGFSGTSISCLESASGVSIRWVGISTAVPEPFLTGISTGLPAFLITGILSGFLSESTRVVLGLC